ncbi:hypothetical protein TRVL_08001 [Trypanosoma vivax]|nr:hypothetical protein TRVL_08001 [Trypanosoma vivax]
MLQSILKEQEFWFRLKMYNDKQPNVEERAIQESILLDSLEKAMTGTRFLLQNVKFERDSLEQLRICTRLTHIEIIMCKGIFDLSILANLGSLEVLSVRGSRVHVTGSIGGLKNLRELDLSGTRVQDEVFYELSENPNLTKVNLRQCQGLSDVSPLADIESLQELDLGLCRSINEGVQDLAELPNLRVLNLEKVNVPSDSLFELCKSRSLEKLNLSSCKRLLDVSPLSEIKTLVELDLSLCCSLFTGVSELGKLQCLRILNLRNTAVTDHSLPGLSESDSLEILNLSSCRGLTNVSPLKEIKSLVQLDLSNCPALRDGIGSLVALPFLCTLKLRNTAITNESLRDICESESLEELDASSCTALSDVFHISVLNTLVELNLSFCPNLVKGMEAIASLPFLRALDISGTPITNHCLRGLRKSNSLETVSLRSCNNLTDVFYLSKISTLLRLDLGCCISLQKGVGTLGKLPRLRILNLEGTRAANDWIIGLSTSRSLAVLILSSCLALSDVSLLANIEPLEELDISNCVSIRSGAEALLKLPQIRVLKMYDVNAFGKHIYTFEEKGIDVYF